MKEQTGLDYQSSQYGKILAAAEAKMGKTMFLLGGLLGVLPWQRRGAVVTSPKHLHVVSFDANALGGARRFLLESCKAKEEALSFRVYNMQDDLHKIAMSETKGYDRTFFNTVMTVIHTVQERVAREGGVHALMFSSLTGLSDGLMRGVSGPAGSQKGSGMDQSKWQDFAAQITEVRNYAQNDAWHCIWEAHIHKVVPMNQDEAVKETLQIPGKSGQNFPYNVEYVFRIRREHGNKYENKEGKKYNADLIHLDSSTAFEFAGGRNFNESLEPKEYDLTKVFQKLGLKVGQWGAPKEKK